MLSIRVLTEANVSKQEGKIRLCQGIDEFDEFDDLVGLKPDKI